MKNNNLPKSQARTSVFRALTTALFLILLNTFVAAQSSNTDGTTPAGLKPGAPAGAYGLTGFENVNLYNGNLNFSMPLLQVGGRGGAGYTVPLVVEQKWRVETWPESFPGQGPIYTPLGTWWTALKPGYGPGVLEGRRGGYEDYPFEHYCGLQSSGFYNQMLTRLTFTASDGTEFELRDQLTNGEPKYLSGVPCESPGSSRGTVFTSADGTAATFISDTTIYDHKYKPLGLNDQFRPSGYLMLRDGTRYRIENGLVIWLRDRNGNRLTFVYDGSGRVTTVTDSINRQVSFSYSGTNGFSYDLITYKGFGGQARSIKVWKTSLGNVLRSGYSLQTYAQLFPNMGGASSFSNFNPSRVSAVELPDGRSYQLRYNSYGELARVELPTGGAFEYDWIDGNILLNEGIIYRRVSERRVYANGTTLALYALLQTIFSSASSSKRTGLSTTDTRSQANASRAGVIDVLTGGADPTGGARRWDGTDFLAWGLRSPNGTPHNKFEEHASINIPGAIYRAYEAGQRARWGNSVRYGATRYNIPAAVFTNRNNWANGNDFHYVTGAKNMTRNLTATGARGHTIFWKF